MVGFSFCICCGVARTYYGELCHECKEKSKMKVIEHIKGILDELPVCVTSSKDFEFFMNNSDLHKFIFDRQVIHLVALLSDVYGGENCDLEPTEFTKMMLDNNYTEWPSFLTDDMGDPFKTSGFQVIEGEITGRDVSTYKVNFKMFNIIPVETVIPQSDWHKGCGTFKRIANRNETLIYASRIE